MVRLLTRSDSRLVNLHNTGAFPHFNFRFFVVHQDTIQEGRFAPTDRITLLGLILSRLDHHVPVFFLHRIIESLLMACLGAHMAHLAIDAAE